MRIQVIGSSGSTFPGSNLPAFLLDDFMLIDAGTVGIVLDNNAQRKISHILITHAHLDHINGIPFFVDNIINDKHQHQISIISVKDVLSEIKGNIFNNRIWPDFSAIPNKKKPILKYQEIKTTGCLQIKGYKIFATRVTHAVAAYGYIIEDQKGNAVVYTGDTGPTEKLWKRMSHHNVRALIVEVSFPNSMNDLAVKTGHLTPSLLEEELRKIIKLPEKIYVSHIKLKHKKVIERELERLGSHSLEVLEGNAVILL